MFDKALDEEDDVIQLAGFWCFGIAGFSIGLPTEFSSYIYKNSDVNTQLGIYGCGEQDSDDYGDSRRSLYATMSRSLSSAKPGKTTTRKLMPKG